ncbi:hypothetical protein ACFQ0T_28535 [Kitasatospora gansuensis]
MSDVPEGAAVPAQPAPATAVLPQPVAVPGPGRWDEQPRSPYRTMPEAERSALWRQRLHEAEAGLTRYLVSRGTAST